MSDLMLGVLGWLGVGVVTSLVIGRYMRMPEQDELPESARENAKLGILPAYGGEDADAKSRDDAR